MPNTGIRQEINVNPKELTPYMKVADICRKRKRSAGGHFPGFS
jgi:hypothetical protein